MTVVNITQFDIALSGMIMSEIISIFTVRHLLNTKKFVKNKSENSADGNDGNDNADAAEDEAILLKSIKCEM
jgi:hypothetical protein